MGLVVACSGSGMVVALVLGFTSGSGSVVPALIRTQNIDIDLGFAKHSTREHLCLNPEQLLRFHLGVRFVGIS